MFALRPFASLVFALRPFAVVFFGFSGCSASFLFLTPSGDVGGVFSSHGEVGGEKTMWPALRGGSNSAAPLRPRGCLLLSDIVNSYYVILR